MILRWSSLSLQILVLLEPFVRAEVSEKLHQEIDIASCSQLEDETSLLQLYTDDILQYEPVRERQQQSMSLAALMSREQELDRQQQELQRQQEELLTRGKEVEREVLKDIRQDAAHSIGTHVALTRGKEVEVEVLENLRQGTAHSIGSHVAMTRGKDAEGEVLANVQQDVARSAGSHVALTLGKEPDGEELENIQQGFAHSTGDDALHSVEAKVAVNLAGAEAQLSSLTSKVNALEQSLHNRESARDEGESTPRESPLNTLMFNEIEFELRPAQEVREIATKSKLVLAILEGTVLPACFGVDRCYMGQPCLGVIKGVTIGGLMVWYLIDLVIVNLNIIQQEESIDFFGFQAYFGPDQVKSALIACIVLIAINIIWFCFTFDRGYASNLGASDGFDGDVKEDLLRYGDHDDEGAPDDGKLQRMGSYGGASTNRYDHPY